jgi:putative hydrolase of HD superfamily
VGEHTAQMALMAYFLRDEFPQVDMDKVIRMCLIHDLGEAFTGDIPTFLKTAADEGKEDDLLDKWVSALPEPYRSEMTALYAEMAARETIEAKLYKALDGLEAVIQHNDSPLDTWLPLEYELNLTYAEDRVTFSPYLTALRAEIRRITEEKIANEKKEEH